MSSPLKRLLKDEDAFYVVEYVILTSLVVVFLVGTIEFAVIGSPNDLMGTSMKGGDSGADVRSSEMKTVGGALSPVYKFIVTIMGMPIA